MNEISNNTLEAHYSSETKVRRPIITVADAPSALINSKMPYTEKEAKEKLATLNNDIYVSTKKEKSKHEFDKKLFFKIMGGVLLCTVLIAGIRKFKNFFRKS